MTCVKGYRLFMSGVLDHLVISKRPVIPVQVCSAYIGGSIDDRSLSRGIHARSLVLGQGTPYSRQGTMSRL